MNRFKHGKRYCSWAFARQPRATWRPSPANKLTETTYIFDIGKPCYDQFTPIRHLLTSNTFVLMKIRCSFKLTDNQVLVFRLECAGGSSQINCQCDHGRVVSKPVIANSGLKVNQNVDFLAQKVFFHWLCFEHFENIQTQKAKYYKQKKAFAVTRTQLNSRLSGVSLVEVWITQSRSKTLAKSIYHTTFVCLGCIASPACLDQSHARQNVSNWWSIPGDINV